MADNRLSQAILAVESGNKVKARELLASILRQDPKSADAWRWMAIALDDPDKKRQCWQQVLNLKPGDEQAVRALAEIEIARQTPSTPHQIPKRTTKKQTKSRRWRDSAYWTRLLLIGGIPIVLLGLCVVLAVAGALFRPSEKAAATSTPLPGARSLEPQAMYFCSYNRCKDSQQYGEVIDPPILAIWRTPIVGRDVFVREPEHGEKVTVIGEWREYEGPGGLWYELEGGGWSREWNLTDTICGPDNIDEYSYTSCEEGEY